MVRQGYIVHNYEKYEELTKLLEDKYDPVPVSAVSNPIFYHIKGSTVCLGSNPEGVIVVTGDLPHTSNLFLAMYSETEEKAEEDFKVIKDCLIEIDPSYKLANIEKIAQLI